MSEVYNVLLPVVALVRAESAEDAVRQLAASLSRKGFTVYTEDFRASAFLSEDGVDAEALP